jgi:hypothetical protein
MNEAFALLRDCGELRQMLLAPGIEVGAAVLCPVFHNLQSSEE